MEREALAAQRAPSFQAPHTSPEELARTDAIQRRNGVRTSTDPEYIPLSQRGRATDIEAEAAAQTKVNGLAAEIATIQAGKTTLVGQEKRETAEILAQLRLEKQLLAANVGEEEILLRLESLRTAQAAKRVLDEKATSGRGGAKNAEQFARGAGFFQATGGAFAIGGIAAAAGVAGIVEATKAGLAYSLTLKEVSDQLGISTKALQIFQSAGESAGVKTEQLRETLGQVSSNLGKAQEGSETQTKLFKALGIDIGNSRDGYKTLGDVLPTIADRLSKVGSQTQRNALETALGGEQLRKLDPILKQGSAGLDQLGDSLERSGAILSSGQIAHAAKVASDLKRVGDQLQRELASVVSQNADAILGLARAFGTAASEGLKLVSSLQRFGALQAASGRGIFSTDSTQKFGRDFLNQSAAGRTENRQRLTAARTNISNLEASDIPRENIPGIGVVENTPEGIRAARAKLTAQRNEVRTAANADRVSDVATQAGNPDQSAVDKLFAPKGPKGKSAETLAKQADERQKRYEDQLAQLNDEYLTAQRSITAGADEQLALDSAKIEADRVRKNGDIQREANEKQIDASKVKELQAANDKAAAEKKSGLLIQHQVELQGSLNDLQQQSIQDHIDSLRDESAFAQTTVERKRLADAQLRDERKAETLKLTAIVKSDDPNDPNYGPSVSNRQRAAAQRQLDTQDDRFASKQRASDRQNQGPGASFLSALRFNSDDKNEFIQTEEVKTLDEFNKGLDDSVKKALHLHGIFGDILGDLIDMAIKQALIKPLAESLFGGKGGTSGGNGLSGIFGSIGKLFGRGGGDPAASIGAGAGDFSFSGIPGFANGGSATIGGNPGIDQNVLSINGRPSLRVGSGEQLTITPNNQKVSPAVQGPAQIVQHITVDQRNSVVPAEFAGQILDVADARSRQHAAQAGQAAVSAAPGRIRSIQTLGN